MRLIYYLLLTAVPLLMMFWNLESTHFCRYSANSSSILLSLKECVDRHIKLASDTFKTIWEANILILLIGLFIAYIVDERMRLFGDRWMAEAQIENIKNWESKYELDSTLSNNYGSCLEFFCSKRTCI